MSEYGLKANALSPLETLAQSVALIAPTGAPVMTIGLVYGLAGDGCAVAYLIAMLSMLLVALNVNQFARLSASPGSLYTYIADHMHPVWGIVAGWALLIAYVGTAAAVSAGVINYANVILQSQFGLDGNVALFAALIVLIAGWLAYRDVEISTRVMLWLEAGSVALIAAVAGAVLFRHGARLDWPQITLSGVPAEKLRLGLVLAIFSSVGFESATSLGSEARDPLISIPRAVKLSAILAGVFFAICAYAEVVAFRGEPQTLGQSIAPMHVLARRAGFPPVAGTLTDLGAVVSFFSCVLACVTAAARILFLMARRRALPEYWGEAHTSNQTPHRAVLLCAVAVFVPTGALALRGVSLPDIFGLLGALATFGFVTAYLLIAVAAPLHLRTSGSRVLGLLAVVAMIVALVGSVYPVPPAPYSWLPYIYAVAMLAGFGWSLKRTKAGLLA